MKRFIAIALVITLWAPISAQQATDEQIKALRDALTAAVDQLVAGQQQKPPVTNALLVAAHTPAEFQTALNTAAPGSIIVLDSSKVYSGNFLLPQRDRTALPITVTSSANVPPEGVRISPALMDKLAILSTPNNVPVIDGPSGSHNFRFIGLTFKAGSGVVNDIVRFGYGLETSSTLYPTGFVLDRVIIRGDPVLGAKRGVLANAHNVTLKNSDVRDVFRAGQDTTTFGCFNCGDGYVVSNNHLESGGEVIIFGGAPSAAKTIATNVLVEGNELTRPVAWKCPTCDYQVKNLFELKECFHCVIRGNVMWNNWAAAQAGTTIVITPRDPDKSIQDVTFENNVVYNMGSVMSISSHDNHSVTPVATNGIRVKNNLFILDQVKWGGDGRLVLIFGPAFDIVFDHNTVIQKGSTYGSLIAGYEGSYPTATGQKGGGPIAGFVFTNNAAPSGEYGIIANGSMNGVNFLGYFPGATMSGNVMAGNVDTTKRYPAGNLYPSVVDFQAMFTNYTAEDYRPSAKMPLGSDGKPAGVDFTKLPAFSISSQ